jgi:hypothetical protein
MSEAPATIVSMEELTLIEKCRILSDYLVWVFEGYWVEKDPKVTEEDILFALSYNAPCFQLAFGIFTGTIKEDGLTEKGLADIENIFVELLGMYPDLLGE